MRGIRNAMAAAAQQAGGNKPADAVGIIDGYDPNTYTARVNVMPAGVLTGWIPLPTLWVGAGWGMQVGPRVGDVCTLGFQGGGIDTAIVTGYLYNDGQRPLPVPSGEFWLTHQTGAFMRLTNAGAVMLADPHGAVFQLNGNGSITSAATVWNHTGPVNVTGQITATVDVVGGGVSLKNHITTGVKAGPDLSGPPQ